MEKYRNAIRCVHIDPPYNTNTSGFLYKNNYQHSSWLTMMENRLSLAEQLLAPDSCILCHIDEHEYENLFQVFSALPMRNQGTLVWDKRNPVSGANRIATQHEYVVCRSKGNIKLQYRSLNREAILKKASTLVKKHGGPSHKNAVKNLKIGLRINLNLVLENGPFQKLTKMGSSLSNVHMGAPEHSEPIPNTFKPLIHPVTTNRVRFQKTVFLGETPEFMQGC